VSIAVAPSSARTAAGLRAALAVPAVHEEGTRTVVVLRGEADLAARPVLADVLSRVIALRAGDVVIDLTEAEFLDTAIVRALAVGEQLLDRRGRRLTFRSPSRLAARVLDVFGLSDLIETEGFVQL
jgi:anti-anti-sigma factor